MISSKGGVRRAKRRKENSAIAFWEQLLNDPEADIKDRLKASEFLAKAQKTFTEEPLTDRELNVTIRVVE